MLWFIFYNADDEENISQVNGCFKYPHTWKTLGADTRQARAEERVAAKIPAVMRGLNADTMLIAYREKTANKYEIIQTLFALGIKR